MSNAIKTKEGPDFLLQEVLELSPLFTKLGIKSDLTFKRLFKPAISKDVLVHYIDEVEKGRSTLLDYKADDKALLADLVFNNPELSLRKILQVYGLKKAMDTINLRELRAMLLIQIKKTYLDYLRKQVISNSLSANLRLSLSKMRF